MTATDVIVGQLLENAYKYSPDGGAVVVSARPAGEWVEVMVDDEGIGIAPGEHERIFELLIRRLPRRPDPAARPDSRPGLTWWSALIRRPGLTRRPGRSWWPGDRPAGPPGRQVVAGSRTMGSPPVAAR